MAIDNLVYGDQEYLNILYIEVYQYKDRSIYDNSP